MNKKQQLIYNALVLDRDETKRALQMPNVAPATAELLAAKLAGLNELIRDPKNWLMPGTPVKTFPKGGHLNTGGEDNEVLIPGRLRDYQQKAVDRVNELAAQGKSVVMDTGRRAGKSLIEEQLRKDPFLLPAKADGVYAPDPAKLEAIAIKQMERLLKGAISSVDEEYIAAKGLDIIDNTDRWGTAKTFVAEHNQGTYTPAEYWHKVRQHFLKIGGEYIGQRCSPLPDRSQNLNAGLDKPLF